MAAAAMALAASGHSTAARVAVSDLAGRPAVLAPYGESVTTLFWRADCGPCLLELSDLDALRRAARPGRLVAVALQGGGDLRVALRKLKLTDADSLVATEDPATLLTTFGGAPPRLPLSVAFDGEGRVCGRHTGYLGRDQVKAWAKACGGALAAR